MPSAEPNARRRQATIAHQRGTIRRRIPPEFPRKLTCDRSPLSADPGGSLPAPLPFSMGEGRSEGFAIVQDSSRSPGLWPPSSTPGRGLGNFLDAASMQLLVKGPAAHRPPHGARWIANTRRRAHRVLHALCWYCRTRTRRTGHRLKFRNYSATGRASLGHRAIRGHVCAARAVTSPTCWYSYRLRCVGLPTAAADYIPSIYLENWRIGPRWQRYATDATEPLLLRDRRQRPMRRVPRSRGRLGFVGRRAGVAEHAARRLAPRPADMQRHGIIGEPNFAAPDAHRHGSLQRRGVIGEPGLACGALSAE